MNESSARTELEKQVPLFNEQSTGTEARRLRQPWLSVARVVWVVVLIFNLAVLLVGTVVAYGQARTVCDPAQDMYSPAPTSSMRVPGASRWAIPATHASRLR